MAVTVTKGAGVGTGKGTRALAWISYGLAVVGGSALMATDPGSWIAATIGVFPQWVAVFLFGAGLVGMCLDLFLDRIPNRLAVWMAILLPSSARAVHGQLGADVRDVATHISGAADARLSAWIGQSSLLAIAAFCVAVALLMARRVVRKGAA